MTTVQDILTFMEGLAPYKLAESWDNVGLLCGDRAQEVTSVLCALDVTETVVQEAVERGAQLVVAHHPAIFTSVSRVTSDDTTGRVLRYAIKHDISIICMHTNADCAEGGVNDALASALFLTNVVSMEAGENGMLGRVGDLPREMQPREFALYVKECLRAGGVRFCDGGKPITRVAVGGGACGGNSFNRSVRGRIFSRQKQRSHVPQRKRENRACRKTRQNGRKNRRRGL